MRYKMFSIYDRAVDAYMRPFMCKAEGEALREFINLRNSEGSAVYSHPHDFSLFLIGTFNDNDGELVSCVPKRLMGAHESLDTEDHPDPMFPLKADDDLPLMEVKDA